MADIATGAFVGLALIIMCVTVLMVNNIRRRRK